ncbi:MAG: hypothetical protein ABEK59_05635 [Halobacteria archaeon]
MPRQSLRLFHPIHVGEGRRQELDDEDVTPRLFVFDVLAVDGGWIVGESLEERKETLEETVDGTESIEVVDFRNGEFDCFFQEVVDSGGEGLMLKRLRSRYHPGVRSSEWLKVKKFSERDCVVVGYTEGEGSRSETFGALVLTDGENYVGRVGTGFDESERKRLIEEFEETGERSVSRDAVERSYTPVDPFVVEVRYQEVTDDGSLRAPVYVRSRFDKPVDDVVGVGK